MKIFFFKVNDEEMEEENPRCFNFLLLHIKVMKKMSCGIIRKGNEKLRSGESNYEIILQREVLI